MPILLLMVCSPFTPLWTSVRIRFSGIPHRPNPPNITLWPERISAIASRALSQTLFNFPPLGASSMDASESLIIATNGPTGREHPAKSSGRKRPRPRRHRPGKLERALVSRSAGFRAARGRYRLLDWTRGWRKCVGFGDPGGQKFLDARAFYHADGDGFDRRLRSCLRPDDASVY